jgi:arginine decarboxylase
MPIDRLDTKPTNPATLWDITCDSDGEIPFNRERPIYLHDINLETDEYFLAFFLTGAYQEILGMRHNLFTHPTEVIVNFNEHGEYFLDGLKDGENLMGVLEDMDYDISLIDKQLKYMIEESNLLSHSKKRDFLGKLYLYLSENSYLKTTQIEREEHNG